MRKNIAASCMFMSHIMNTFYSGSSVTMTSKTCSERYDMDDLKKIQIVHDGFHEFSDNPCQIEFFKSSYKQYLCVYIDEISLDCDTALEYHEGFVKNIIQPEKKISCNTSIEINEEWCSSQYEDNIYVVIRKSSRHTSDVIKLRVCLKDVPESDDDTIITSLITIIIICVVISVAFVVMCTCLFGIFYVKSQKNRTQRPHVKYQTTSGAAYEQAEKGNKKIQNIAKNFTLQQL